MTARDRNDDEADAPTLRLDTIDPSVADAPDDVSLGALLGIQRRTQRQPSRLGRILRTSIVMVLWLGTAAGATTAAWTVHDLLHDDHVTDGALLPNLDLRPAGKALQPCPGQHHRLPIIEAQPQITLSDPFHLVVDHELRHGPRGRHRAC